MKKYLALFLILLLSLLALGCQEKPPKLDEEWTLGFSIVAHADDLSNPDNLPVGFVDSISLYLPLQISKDGEVSGGCKDQIWETNKMSVEGQGRYQEEILYFTGTWEAESQYDPPLAGYLRSGTFTIQGKYAENVPFELNEDKSHATISGRWFMNFNDEYKEGADHYDKAPVLTVHHFGPGIHYTLEDKD